MSNVVTCRVSDEVLAMIDRLASSRQRSRAWVVGKLLEESASKQDAFDRSIDEAEASIARGEGISQEEMERWLEDKIAKRALAVAAE